jgi:hypothetical protein
MIRKREKIHPQTMMFQLQQPLFNKQEETEAEREAKMSGLEEFVSIKLPRHTGKTTAPHQNFSRAVMTSAGFSAGSQPATRQLKGIEMRG